VPNCKSFLVTEAERSMSGDARVWSLCLVVFQVGLRTYQHPGEVTRI